MEAASCFLCNATTAAGSDARPVILPDPKHRDEMMMIAAPVCPPAGNCRSRSAMPAASRFCEKISGGKVEFHHAGLDAVRACRKYGPAEAQ
jgi:hypothetical protein